jgi:protocatechuate 3,4-dioxygenase beta subunit
MMMSLWASYAGAQAPQPPPGLPFPQAPSRDPSKTGTAVIRGHVFDAASGQPLRKAQVRAFSPELRENRAATTDANGAYELKELVAGRYQLNASKGSFVQLQYGQTRPFEPGKPLELANGQTVERVDFKLPRGGIITGRILDEFGEPTSDVQVMAMRYQYIQGRRQLSPSGRPATTNDIGEYRIFALPPGQYFLSATYRGGQLAFDTQSDDRSGYAPTYYPNGASVADAQRVTVGVGQTLSDINFALSPTRLARVTGTAVDSDGKPLANSTVIMLQVSGALMMSTAGGQTRPDGSFSIANVSPGDYSVQAMSAALAGPGAERVQAKITVAGDDIVGLRLTGVKSSTVNGRIILPQTGTSMSVSALQLGATPSTYEFLSGGGTARINDDATFEMRVLPGNYLIRMTPQGIFANVRIKAVRLNGLDVTDTGVDVRPNEDLNGLEVELTTQVSDLSGFVTNTRGENVKDYSIVVFSRDRERWGFASRYLGGGRPDQDGKYRVRSLPPGNYYAIALDYVEQGAGTEPEFLDRMKDRATEFSLNEGETKTLELRLVTGL